jgi:3-methyladenine DNA glycosylase AlkD
MQRKMQVRYIMEWMQEHASKENLEGMARFGINTKNAFGISMDELRKYGKYDIKPSHELALGLWKTGKHEARILASIVDEENQVEEDQMEQWVMDFDSWDLCDQVCLNLFYKTGFAYIKAEEWASERQEEFVKRAGFVLMAVLAVHDKRGSNKRFLRFLEIIKEQSSDDRNIVKKAINWALRQIGKRNKLLNSYAMETAMEMSKMESKTAKWIGSDALKELESKEVQHRLED